MLEKEDKSSQFFQRREAKVTPTCTYFLNAIKAFTLLKNGNFALGLENGDLVIVDTVKEDDFSFGNFPKDTFNPVHAILELADSRIVCGTEDGRIRIYNPKEFHDPITDKDIINPEALITEEIDKNCYIRAIKQWNDKEIVIAAIKPDKSSSIYAYTIETGEYYKLASDKRCFTTMAILKNGNIACGSSDGVLSIIDNKGNMTQSKRHLEGICALAQLNDGSIITSAWDSVICYNNEYLATASMSDPVRCMIPLSDPDYWLGGTNRGKLQLWNKQTGKKEVFACHDDTIIALYETDGNILSVTQNGTAKICSLDTLIPNMEPELKYQT